MNTDPNIEQQERRQNSDLAQIKVSQQERLTLLLKQQFL